MIYALYLVDDAILATKSGMVTFFGMFLITTLKMAYKEPKPYWVDTEIRTFYCTNDFEGPCDHLFILTFLFTYLNLIYLNKYARLPFYNLSTVLFIFQAIMAVSLIFAGLLLGSFYIY
jgi:type III secretory pathway component EscU